MDELVGRSAFRADDGDVVAEFVTGIAAFRRNEGSIEKVRPPIHHLPGAATAIAASGSKRGFANVAGVALMA